MIYANKECKEAVGALRGSYSGSSRIGDLQQHDTIQPSSIPTIARIATEDQPTHTNQQSTINLIRITDTCLRNC